MTGYTPIYNLPYPQPSDLVSAYPGTGQDLAEEVETVLAAKAPLASPTFTGNVVWSGATLRAAGAKVATSQTTTSTSYTDLATAGPSVTLTTGTKALVIINTWLRNNTSGSVSVAGVAISGASTVSANDDQAVYLSATGTNVPDSRISTAVLFTGLTAGSNTFTMKYRVTGGTGQFQARELIVIDMGS